MLALQDIVCQGRNILLDTSSIGLELTDTSQEMFEKVKYILSSINPSDLVHVLPEVLDEISVLRTVFNEGKKKLKRNQRRIKKESYNNEMPATEYKLNEVERKGNAIRRLITGFKRKILRFEDNPLYEAMRDIVFHLEDISHFNSEPYENRKPEKIIATALFLTAYLPRGSAIISGYGNMAPLARTIVGVLEDEQFSPLNDSLARNLRSKGLLVYFKAPYSYDYEVRFDSRDFKPAGRYSLSEESKKLIAGRLIQSRQQIIEIVKRVQTALTTGPSSVSLT